MFINTKSMNYYKYLSLIFFYLISNVAFSQGEANNWFFGRNAGISFANGAPVAIADGQINTLEGCTSISSPTGALLFYTDGRTVWNKNHVIMPNGNGLNGDDSSTSSALIVPKPDDPLIYYVFTVDEPNHNDSASQINGLNYSVVNITLDNGNGDVVPTQKNIPLITYNASNTLESKYKCSEKITAVRSADCTSLWLITHFTNKFYSFNIDVTGVNPNPIISTTQTTTPVSGYRRNAIGYLKASPNGDKLLIAHNGFGTTTGGNSPGGVLLYDFDAATGIVTNEIILHPESSGHNPYGVEFSPNGERAYATVRDPNPDDSFLLQYDLTATNIPASEVTIDISSNFAAGALQLGPDGKIYRALFDFNSSNGAFLGVINNPELLGAAVNYVENGIPLNLPTTGITERSSLGLPPFIQSLFAESVDIIQNGISTFNLELCDGDDYTLVAPITVGATYEWEFNGSPVTTTAPLNEFVLTSPGLYHVEIDLNNGECPIYGDANVITFPLPLINPITNLEACFDASDGLSTFTLSDATLDAINGQANVVVSYHDNLLDAQSGTNPLANIYDSSGETIYVYLENTITNCVNTTTFNLIVNPLPVITPVTLEQCDDDTDGISIFNLAEANVLLSANSATETFIYYNSLSDAETNTNPIVNPDTYLSPTGGVVFSSITDTNNCVSFGQVNLSVGTSQIPNTFHLNYTECDDDYDGTAIFDFSNAHPQILGLFASSVNITVSYFESQSDALIEINPIIDISNYQSSTPTTQEIWVRVDSNDLNGCLGLGHHITLNVNPIPVTTILDDLVACGDTTAEFNLMDNTLAASGGVANVVITYHDSLFNAQNGINALVSQYNSSPKTIYVRSENTTIPGCYSIMDFELLINPNPSISLPDPLEICDENADGFEVFDLTMNTSQISTNSNFTITYHLSIIDAENGVNAISNTDLTTFSNTVNPQAIIVRVENNTTNCYSITIQSLRVLPKPTPLSTQEISDNFGVMTICDANVDGDGSLAVQEAEFDVSLWETAIIGGEHGVSPTYFTSYDEAVIQANPIFSPENHINIGANPQTIYVRVTNNITGCFTIVNFDIFVPLPNVILSTTTDLLCIDANGVPLSITDLPVLSTVVNPNNTLDYTYSWMLNGITIPGKTSSTLTVSQAGNYTVNIANISNNTTMHDDTLCINSDSITIIQSAEPDNFEANVTTNAFSNSHQIIATATSTLNTVSFNYAMDNLVFNTTGIFNDVTPGLHTIVIRDDLKCWSETINVLVIDYPRFFTPNNDGINDIWKIHGQSLIPISQIYIFDRFGKLLKQLDPDSLGWDGTYNGNPVPATDYWFKIIYIEGASGSTEEKEFKGHFSLKR